jgi:hypothetical protein
LFKGKVYEFPAPGFRADRAHTVDDPEYIDPKTGELTKLSIYPRARQNPLPMWEMVNSLDSIEHAAQQDLGIIMWRPPLRCAGGCARIATGCARLPARTCHSAPEAQ